MSTKLNEKKIKDTLIKNWSIKILSFLISVILWMVVINISDPEITRSVTSVVNIINDNVLTDAGKYYSIPNNNNTVTFKITAKRSIIEKLTGSDFTAVADMRELEDNTRIPIEITANKMASQVTIAAKQYYQNVSVESQMSGRYAITAATTGTPAEGCVVQSVKAVPEFIEVTGREFDIKRIDKVVATVDISGRGSDLSAMVIPVFYDSEGDAIDTTNIETSSAMVELTCSLTNIKTVPITVETSGELSKDLEIDEIETIPTTIVIQGNKSLLNNITSITVPGDVINLSNVTGDFSTTVDITSYLPNGVALNDPSTAQVKISVVIARPVSKTFQIGAENISVKNLSDKYEAALKDSSLEVTITGVTSKIDRLDAAKITGYVDAEGLSSGSSVVPVTFNLNADDYDIDDVTVTLVLRDRRPPETTDTSTTGDKPNNNQSNNTTSTNPTGNTNNTTNNSATERR